MNDELKGNFLLKQAILDGDDRNLVAGAAENDFFLQVLAPRLRHVFCMEALPVASMNINPPCYQRFFLSTGNAIDGRAKQISLARSGYKSSLSVSPSFYTFKNSNRVDDIPTAIIDSGSCCSVVGKETLDRAMEKLGIDELTDEAYVNVSIYSKFLTITKYQHRPPLQTSRHLL